MICTFACSVCRVAASARAAWRRPDDLPSRAEILAVSNSISRRFRRGACGDNLRSHQWARAARCSQGPSVQANEEGQGQPPRGSATSPSPNRAPTNVASTAANADREGEVFGTPQRRARTLFVHRRWLSWHRPRRACCRRHVEGRYCGELAIDECGMALVSTSVPTRIVTIRQLDDATRPSPVLRHSMGVYCARNKDGLAHPGGDLAALPSATWRLVRRRGTNRNRDARPPAWSPTCAAAAITTRSCAFFRGEAGCLWAAAPAFFCEVGRGREAQGRGDISISSRRRLPARATPQR